MTLLDSFHDTKLKFKDKIAIFDGKRHLSYRFLDFLSDNLSSYILKLNLGNPRGLIIGERTAGSIVTILALIKAGFSYTFINFMKCEEDFNNCISILKPSIIIIIGSDAKLEELIFKYNSHILYFDRLFCKFNNFQIPNGNSRGYNKQPNSNFIAYIFFTSGSTGAPKGVCVSNEAANFAIDSYINLLGFNYTDKMGNCASFFHDISVFDIFSSLSIGATLYLVTKSTIYVPDKFIKYLFLNNINSIFLVPSLLRHIFTNCKDINMLKSLKLTKILFSGEFISKELYSKVIDKFGNKIMIWNLYGATEMPFVFAEVINNYQHHNIFLYDQDCGKIKIFNIRSKDDQDKDFGELLIKSPTLFSAYITKSGMIYPFDNDGWYHTGDIFFRQGNKLTLHGRCDRQVKINGNRVELDELELRLQNLALVDDVAVVYNHGTLLFFIVCDRNNNGTENTKDQILNFFIFRFPDLNIEPKIIFINSIPKTKSGKKNRKALLNLSE